MTVELLQVEILSLSKAPLADAGIDRVEGHERESSYPLQLASNHLTPSNTGFT